MLSDPLSPHPGYRGDKECPLKGTVGLGEPLGIGRVHADRGSAASDPASGRKAGHEAQASPRPVPNPVDKALGL